MKPLAIILVILLVLALVGVGYLYFTSGVEVSYDSVIATDPVTQAEAFEKLKAGLESGSFVGTVYDSSPLGEAGDYLFYTWTVKVDNKSFLPVDTVEIQVTPRTGDVVRYGDTDEFTVSAKDSGYLSVTLLTRRNMNAVREAIVSWYAWGHPFSTRLTIGE